MMKLRYTTKDFLVELKMDLRNFNPNKENEELVVIIDSILSEDSKRQEESINTLKRICSLNTNVNYADAHVILGYCHSQGIIVDKDEKRAFECYEIASKSGSVIGLTRLAGLYYVGKGVDRDIARAINMLQTASRQGYVGAKVLLAIHYQANQNHHDFIKFLQEAVDLKSSYAMSLMSWIYLGSYPGTTIAKDINKGIELLSVAAEHLISAQAKLGMTYLGMDMASKTIYPYIKRDAPNAYAYLKKAMEGGHPEAGINFSYCYIWGVGVERNVLKAFEILEALAKQGEVSAKDAIAKMMGIVVAEYFDGNKNCCAPNSNAKNDISVTVTKSHMSVKASKSRPDFKKGFELLNRAAILGGHSIELAICYEHGIGVEQDSKKASECYGEIMKKDGETSINVKHAYVNNFFGQMKNNRTGFESENNSKVSQEEKVAFYYLNKLISQFNDAPTKINEIALYSGSRLAVLTLVGHPEIDKEERKDVNEALALFLPMLFRGLLHFGLSFHATAEENAKHNLEQLDPYFGLASFVPLLPQYKETIKAQYSEHIIIPIHFPYSVAYHLCWIAQKKLSTISIIAQKQIGNNEEQAGPKNPDLDKPEFYFRMMEVFSSLETSLPRHYNGDAQYYLAQCHEKGYGTAINIPKAICFYQEAIKIKGAHALTPYFIPEEVSLKDVVKREAELREALLPIKDAVLFIFQGFQLNNATALPLALEIAELAMEIPRDSATPYEYLPEYQESPQTAVVAASPVASTATAAL